MAVCDIDEFASTVFPCIRGSEEALDRRKHKKKETKAK